MTKAEQIQDWAADNRYGSPGCEEHDHPSVRCHWCKLDKAARGLLAALDIKNSGYISKPDMISRIYRAMGLEQKK